MYIWFSLYFPLSIIPHYSIEGIYREKGWYPDTLNDGSLPYPTMQDLYDRLTQNKEIFEDYNKNILAAMSEIKQDEKESDAKFIQLLNDVKDELRNDYTNRYNEIITLMGTKVNVQDFDRLETKFDKVTETIIELKTIFQRNLDKK